MATAAAERERERERERGRESIDVDADVDVIDADAESSDVVDVDDVQQQRRGRGALCSDSTVVDVDVKVDPVVESPIDVDADTDGVVEPVVVDADADDLMHDVDVDDVQVSPVVDVDVDVVEPVVDADAAERDTGADADVDTVAPFGSSSSPSTSSPSSPLSTAPKPTTPAALPPPPTAATTAINPSAKPLVRRSKTKPKPRARRYPQFNNGDVGHTVTLVSAPSARRKKARAPPLPTINIPDAMLCSAGPPLTNLPLPPAAVDGGANRGGKERASVSGAVAGVDTGLVSGCRDRGASELAGAGGSTATGAGANPGRGNRSCGRNGVATPAAVATTAGVKEVGTTGATSTSTTGSATATTTTTTATVTSTTNRTNTNAPGAVTTLKAKANQTKSKMTLSAILASMQPPRTKQRKTNAAPPSAAAGSPLSGSAKSKAAARAAASKTPSTSASAPAPAIARAGSNSNVNNKGDEQPTKAQTQTGPTLRRVTRNSAAQTQNHIQANNDNNNNIKSNNSNNHNKNGPVVGGRRLRSSMNNKRQSVSESDLLLANSSVADARDAIVSDALLEESNVANERAKSSEPNVSSRPNTRNSINKNSNNANALGDGSTHNAVPDFVPTRSSARLNKGSAGAPDAPDAKQVKKKRTQQASEGPSTANAARLPRDLVDNANATTTNHSKIKSSEAPSSGTETGSGTGKSADLGTGVGTSTGTGPSVANRKSSQDTAISTQATVKRYPSRRRSSNANNDPAPTPSGANPAPVDVVDPASQEPGAYKGAPQSGGDGKGKIKNDKQGAATTTTNINDINDRVVGNNPKNKNKNKPEVKSKGGPGPATIADEELLPASGATEDVPTVEPVPGKAPTSKNATKRRLSTPTAKQKGDGNHNSQSTGNKEINDTHKICTVEADADIKVEAIDSALSPPASKKVRLSSSSSAAVNRPTSQSCSQQPSSGLVQYQARSQALESLQASGSQSLSRSGSLDSGVNLKCCNMLEKPDKYWRVQKCCTQLNCFMNVNLKSMRATMKNFNDRTGKRKISRCKALSHFCVHGRPGTFKFNNMSVCLVFLCKVFDVSVDLAKTMHTEREKSSLMQMSMTGPSSAHVYGNMMTNQGYMHPSNSKNNNSSVFRPGRGHHDIGDKLYQQRLNFGHSFSNDRTPSLPFHLKNQQNQAQLNEKSIFMNNASTKLTHVSGDDIGMTPSGRKQLKPSVVRKTVGASNAEDNLSSAPPRSSGVFTTCSPDDNDRLKLKPKIRRENETLKRKAVTQSAVDGEHDRRRTDSIDHVVIDNTNDEDCSDGDDSDYNGDNRIYCGSDVDIDVDTRANAIRKRITTANESSRDAILCFFQRLGDDAIDKLPKTGQLRVPFTRKNDVYLVFQREFRMLHNNKTPTSYSNFCKTWKECCSHITLRKPRRIPSIKCIDCDYLIKSRSCADFNGFTNNDILKQRAYHDQLIDSERRFFKSRRERAILRPHQYCSIILDASDQVAIGLPHFRMNNVEMRGHSLIVYFVHCLEHLNGGDRVSVYSLTQEYMCSNIDLGFYDDDNCEGDIGSPVGAANRPATLPGVGGTNVKNKKSYGRCSEPRPSLHAQHPNHHVDPAFEHDVRNFKRGGAGRNHLVEALHRFLTAKREASPDGNLPKTLYIQVDSSYSEVVNRGNDWPLLAFVETLVGVGAVDEVEVLYLPDGHTVLEMDDLISKVLGRIMNCDEITSLDNLHHTLRLALQKEAKFASEHVMISRMCSVANFSGACVQSGCVRWEAVRKLFRFRHFRFTCNITVRPDGTLHRFAECRVRTNCKDDWRPLIVPSSSARTSITADLAASGRGSGRVGLGVSSNDGVGGRERSGTMRKDGQEPVKGSLPARRQEQPSTTPTITAKTATATATSNATIQNNDGVTSGVDVDPEADVAADLGLRTTSSLLTWLPDLSRAPATRLDASIVDAKVDVSMRLESEKKRVNDCATMRHLYKLLENVFRQREEDFHWDLGPTGFFEKCRATAGLLGSDMDAKNDDIGDSDDKKANGYGNNNNVTCDELETTALNFASSFITPARKPIAAAASHRPLDVDPDALPLQDQQFDHHDDFENGTPSITPQSSPENQHRNRCNSNDTPRSGLNEIEYEDDAMHDLDDNHDSGDYPGDDQSPVPPPRTSRTPPPRVSPLTPMSPPDDHIPETLAALARGSNGLMTIPPTPATRPRSAGHASTKKPKKLSQGQPSNSLSASHPNSSNAGTSIGTDLVNLDTGNNDPKASRQQFKYRKRSSVHKEAKDPTMGGVVTVGNPTLDHDENVLYIGPQPIVDNETGMLRCRVGEMVIVKPDKEQRGADGPFWVGKIAKLIKTAKYICVHWYQLEGNNHGPLHGSYGPCFQPYTGGRKTKPWVDRIPSASVALCFNSLLSDGRLPPSIQKDMKHIMKHMF